MPADMSRCVLLSSISELDHRSACGGRTTGAGTPTTPFEAGTEGEKEVELEEVGAAAEAEAVSAAAALVGAARFAEAMAAATMRGSESATDSAMR